MQDLHFVQKIADTGQGLQSKPALSDDSIEVQPVEMSFHQESNGSSIFITDMFDESSHLYSQGQSNQGTLQKCIGELRILYMRNQELSEQVKSTVSVVEKMESDFNKQKSQLVKELAISKMKYQDLLREHQQCSKNHQSSTGNSVVKKEHVGGSSKMKDSEQSYKVFGPGAAFKKMAMRSNAQNSRSRSNTRGRSNGLNQYGTTRESSSRERLRNMKFLNTNISSSGYSYYQGSQKSNRNSDQIKQTNNNFEKDIQYLRKELGLNMSPYSTASSPTLFKQLVMLSARKISELNQLLSQGVQSSTPIKDKTEIISQSSPKTLNYHLSAMVFTPQKAQETDTQRTQTPQRSRNHNITQFSSKNTDQIELQDPSAYESEIIENAQIQLPKAHKQAVYERKDQIFQLTGDVVALKESVAAKSPMTSKAAFCRNSSPTLFLTFESQGQHFHETSPIIPSEKLSFIQKDGSQKKEPVRKRSRSKSDRSPDIQARRLPLPYSLTKNENLIQIPSGTRSFKNLQSLDHVKKSRSKKPSQLMQQKSYMFQIDKPPRALADLKKHPQQ